MKLKYVTQSDGRWYLSVPTDRVSAKTGRPMRKWVPLTRVDEGEAALLAKYLEITGATAEPENGDFGTAVDAWLKQVRPTLTPRVYKEYERIMGQAKTHFRRFNVADILPSECESFLAEHADKPTMRHHVKGRLSSFFRWCVRDDRVKVSPLAAVTVPKPPKSRGRMTADAYWQIFDKLPDIGKCFLRLMYLTRQRPTEIRLLREKQIAGGYITFVPGKTIRSSGEEVKIKISTAIQEALDWARSLNRVKSLPGSDAYVIQCRDGTPYTTSGLRDMWTDAATTAGFKGVTTRHVRPFVLHRMEEAGHDLREIQLSAAHTTVTTTEIYLDQHRDRVSDVVMQEPPRPPKETK